MNEIDKAKEYATKEWPIIWSELSCDVQDKVARVMAGFAEKETAELQAEVERLREALQLIANTGKVSHCPAKSWDAIGKLEQRCNRLVGIANKALEPKDGEL